MAKNEKNNSLVDIDAQVRLMAIQKALPEGYKTTNKKAIKKKIRDKTSLYEETYWTSWVKNGTTKGLALLKANGSVKIITEANYKKYEVNGKDLK